MVKDLTRKLPQVRLLSPMNLEVEIIRRMSEVFIVEGLESDGSESFNWNESIWSDREKAEDRISELYEKMVQDDWDRMDDFDFEYMIEH